MHINSVKDFTQMEEWLVVLLNTYSEHPSSGLAKIILHNLTNILHHDDVTCQPLKFCDYLSMQKYWQWVNNSTNYD